MADDRRIVISSDPGTSPDDLARRSFSTSFRGFDPGEVPGSDEMTMRRSSAIAQKRTTPERGV